jgi:hypothetical protein
MFELMLVSAGGIWLGIFALLVFASLIFSVETDSFLLGGAILLISAVVAEFVFNLPIWASIIANPIMLVLYLAVYIAVGSLYAGYWKLPGFVRKNSSVIQSNYDSWKKDRLRNDRGWTDAVRDHVKGEAEPKSTVDVSFDAFLDSDSYRFKVRNNKDRVASWVLLWPCGVTWELMHKPFIWLWETVYYGLGDVFERINRDTARKILEDNKK